MRDTTITRAAELMSDVQLFATDTVVFAPPTTQASEVVTFRDRPSNQQRTQPVDRWNARTTSSSSGHDAPTLNDNDNSTPNRRNGNGVRNIQFGFSPDAVFDRAETQGSYREFEDRNDEGSSDSMLIGAIITAALRPVTAAKITIRPTVKTRITRLTATAIDSSIPIVTS